MCSWHNLKGNTLNDDKSLHFFLNYTFFLRQLTIKIVSHR